MIGNIYGDLKVIDKLPLIKPAKWKCICMNCGVESNRFGHHLRKFYTAFCTECNHVSKTHGLEGTVVYCAWNSMKQRCLNKAHAAFKNYGARGITVCERWLKFENFYSDMGDPLHGESLDRINNDGNYEPLNCRWATKTMQMQNRRNSIPPILVNGRLVTVKTAALLLGVTVKTIRRRFHKGIREFEIRV